MAFRLRTLGVEQEVASITTALGGRRSASMERWRGSLSVKPGESVPIYVGGRHVRTVLATWGVGRERKQASAFDVGRDRPEAIERRRCVVLATGLYLYRFGDRGPQVWLVHGERHRTILVAGIYDSGLDRRTAQPLPPVVTLLTTRSSMELKDLASSAPLVLPIEQAREWCEFGSGAIAQRLVYAPQNVSAIRLPLDADLAMPRDKDST